MDSKLPPKEQLQQRAAEGHPITQCEASKIAAAESDITGSGPIKGGTAAAAQSVHDKQQNFFAKAGDIARKSPSEVTKEDAAAVQKAEARLLGQRPRKGSMSAAVQSLADKNEKVKEA